MNSRYVLRSGAVSAAMIIASAAGAQVTTNEVEPNDAKTNAQLVTMACGDMITGTSTGTATTGGGATSADTFRIRTISTGSPVFYTLTMTRSDGVLPANTLTLRGLNQSTGVPGTTDSTLVTASTVGTTKVAAWYGTGPVGAQQDMYVRVTGTTSTTQPYILTITCSPVTPFVVPGNVYSGSVTVRPDAATATAVDTDWWAFDGSFNAITNFGHDDADETGAVRTLSPGTYYVALGVYNTCTNLGSPADDTFRTGLLTDFPNVLVNDSTGALGTLNLRVNDGLGNDNTAAGNRAGSYQVAWHQFTVISTPFPTGSGSATPAVIKQGDSSLLTVAVTPVGAPNPSTGITVTADLSSGGGSATQAFFDNGTNGDVTAGDGIYSYSFVPSAFGAMTFPFTVADAQARSSSGSIALSARQVIDLGTLANGLTSPAAVDLAAGEVKFYKFTLANDVSNAAQRFLDIANPASSAGDTEIGVYRADGTLVNSDDQDGNNSLAALSYGLTSPTRAGDGNGVVNNGRDGALVAGTYYLAIGVFNVTFGTPNFNATSTGGATTGFTVTFNLGSNDNPSVVGNPASGTVGGTVLLTATAGSGQNPASTTLAVTGNLSTIGGSSTQQFYDDGTHGDASPGDNVFSYLATIPHAPTQAAGTFNCAVVVTDDLNRTGSGNIAVTLGAEPTGQCCTNGSCSVTTAFLCGGAGGNYGGDGTNCGNISYTITESGNTFTSISGTGTMTSDVINVGTSNCDDCTELLNLPFDFNFFGVNYNQVRVSTNGNLQFPVSNSTAFGNGAIPSAATPNNGIYPFWDDYNTLNTADVGQGAIYFQTTGTAPNRTFTVEWADVTQYRLGAPATYPATHENFQVILYEGSNNIEFRYGTVSPVNTSNVNQGTGVDASGGDCTIGVENAAGTVAYSIPSNGFVPSSRMFTWTSDFTCPPSCPGNECGPADYNGDGDVGTDQDIEAFFACLGGNCCATCWCQGADFNGDGDVGTDQDIEAYFRVLGGGTC